MASWHIKYNFSNLILLTVLFVACLEKEKLPDNILPQKKMTHIMIQVHLLEAKIGQLGISMDSAKVVYQYFERVVLKKAGIDSTRYFESFNYYSIHPEFFADVYAAVTDSLMEMESKEKLKKEAIKRKKEEADSLKMKSDAIQIDAKPIRKNIKSQKAVKWKLDERNSR